MEDGIWALLAADDADGGVRLIPEAGAADRPVPATGTGRVEIEFSWRFTSQPREDLRSLILSRLEEMLGAELDRIAAPSPSAGP